MTDTIEALIASGRALEDEGREEEAVAYFVQLAAQYPDDARVQFETGGAYDSAGHEAEAVIYYRRAIALGLPEDALPKVAVQLGSSLRNIGETAEAVAILEQAAARFPENRAVRAFLALALFSAGRQAEALAVMLHMTVETPGFYERYHRSLRQYADMLVNPDQ